MKLKKKIAKKYNCLSWDELIIFMRNGEQNTIKLNQIIKSYAKEYYKKKLNKDSFKGSPWHDKKAILEILDNLTPTQMMGVIEYLKNI